jgi:hypothetical protein
LAWFSFLLAVFWTTCAAAASNYSWQTAKYSIAEGEANNRLGFKIRQDHNPISFSFLIFDQRVIALIGALMTIMGVGVTIVWLVRAIFGEF